MALATLYIPEIFMKQKFSQSNTKSREFHFANALNSVCSYLTIQQRINPLHCRNIEQTAEIHYKIWPMVYLVSPFITATMNGFSELALVWQFFPPKKGAHTFICVTITLRLHGMLSKSPFWVLYTKSNCGACGHRLWPCCEIIKSQKSFLNHFWGFRK